MSMGKDFSLEVKEDLTCNMKYKKFNKQEHKLITTIRKKEWLSYRLKTIKLVLEDDIIYVISGVSDFFFLTIHSKTSMC